ncbi:CADN-like protein, partial [Mya arenaria]
WGQWSGCDVSCGNGTRSRARSCDNPAPAQGGDDCVGPKHDQDVCVLQTCPAIIVYCMFSGKQCESANLLLINDRSLETSEFTRFRLLSNKQTGDVYKKIYFVDGWNSWSTWSSCSVTCGQGLKHRHRTCNETIGTTLGGGCIGNDQEYAECYITICDTIVLFYAHGPRDLAISTNEKVVYGTITTNKGGGYNSSD